MDKPFEKIAVAGKCKVCKKSIKSKTKPRSYCKGIFVRNKKGGRSYKRSSCELEYIKQWRARHPESVKKYLFNAGVTV
jgi:hypothetical protein